MLHAQSEIYAFNQYSYYFIVFWWYCTLYNDDRMIGDSKRELKNK